MARARNGRLEEALAALTQAEATLVQNQAAFVAWRCLPTAPARSRRAPIRRTRRRPTCGCSICLGEARPHD